jgi:Family of unknown function (DUF6134)
MKRFFGFLMPFIAFGANAQTWDFDVSMDGKLIGTHQFMLTDQKNNQQILKSEAKFNVKILSISFFEYHHQANELWENNCLRSLEAKTQENSKTTIVKGLQEKSAFKISSPTEAEINAECVMTFAYWNPKILDQKKLLNPQTGDYLLANISTIGKENILVKGQTVNADHYKIDTAKFKIDLWYGPNKEWLALQSVTEDGKINYVLK